MFWNLFFLMPEIPLVYVSTKQDGGTPNQEKRPQGVTPSPGTFTLNFVTCRTDHVKYDEE